jgi:hypothetical protein
MPGKDTIYGYEIPMPKGDLFIAITTVALFLPTLIVVHNLVAFIGRTLGLFPPAKTKSS